MSVFDEIAERIIESQEAIIGPVAIEQARQVPNLRLDWEHRQVKIEGDPAQAIDNLVTAYAALFGQISVEVSKEAVTRLLSELGPQEVPKALR